MNNSHELSTQEKWIKLSKNEVKHLFAYYFIIFFASLISVGIIVYKYFQTSLDNIGMILLLSFASGLLGSTFYYIRKLYKSCIQLLVDTQEKDDTVASIGAKAYFYFRPIMGATLSAFIILGVYCGFFFLQDQPTINTDRFLAFSAILSFVVGFSNGNIVVKLDKSRDKITDIIKIGKEEEEQ